MIAAFILKLQLFDEILYLHSDNHYIMFPAVANELSKNPFFQGWKQKSVFLQLVGPPPILYEEFSEKWVEQLTNLLGDGPFTPMFLANLGSQIECLKPMDGYKNIKSKLERLDEQLYPTLSEIEFFDFLFQRTTLDTFKLEKTFTTRSGKTPELKVNGRLGEVFIEVTSIQDFKEKGIILWFFNTFTAFQLSMKTLLNLNRKLIINFNKYPSEEIFYEIYGLLNKHLFKRKQDSSYPLVFNEKHENFSISLDEGNSVEFDYPDDVTKKKIKDKIDEKTSQFDEGELNFVVLDITPVVTNMGKVADFVKDYFEYSGNRIVWGVLLISKKWTFEDFKPTYRIECLHQPNPLLDADKADEVVKDFFS